MFSRQLLYTMELLSLQLILSQSSLSDIQKSHKGIRTLELCVQIHMYIFFFIKYMYVASEEILRQLVQVN